jgi:bifunctional non-homologous end joining protein LigD
MWSGEAGREIDAFVCDDEASLLFLVNLGTIPFHVWGSRVATIGAPDWCILDLDPKGAPFTDVVKIALAAKELCDALELSAFLKTSGSTGLHVLIPLGGTCTFEEAKGLGELLARVLAERLPDIATVIRTPAARGGRVYVDFLQNGQGKLLAAPFSARPVPGALVSTPLEWKEVTRKLDISAFTIRTVPQRLEKRGADPMHPLLTLKPDLPRALDLLARQTGG